MCRFIYSALENFRHYHSACRTVATMAHVSLLIATVNRDIFGRGSSESIPTPPSSPDSKFKCTAIKYEQLETSRVFGCHSCVQKHTYYY